MTLLLMVVSAAADNPGHCSNAIPQTIKGTTFLNSMPGFPVLDSLRVEACRGNIRSIAITSLILSRSRVERLSRTEHRLAYCQY
jgi:hypothetical protein